MYYSCFDSAPNSSRHSLPALQGLRNGDRVLVRGGKGKSWSFGRRSVHFLEVSDINRSGWLMGGCKWRVVNIQKWDVEECSPCLSGNPLVFCLQIFCKARKLGFLTNLIKTQSFK